MFQNQETWVLQLGSSFSKLFWLFGIPWDHIWILGWIYFYKIYSWNFDRDCVESVDFFGWCGHLKILFQINEHRMSFHLFVSLFFQKYSLFSTYKYFASLVRFIPKYFILSDAIINRIVSLVIVSVQTHNWFLCLDFLSFNSDKFVH